MDKSCTIFLHSFATDGHLYVHRRSFTHLLEQDHQNTRMASNSIPFSRLMRWLINIKDISDSEIVLCGQGRRTASGSWSSRNNHDSGRECNEINGRITLNNCMEMVFNGSRMLCDRRRMKYTEWVKYVHAIKKSRYPMNKWLSHNWLSNELIFFFELRRKFNDHSFRLQRVNYQCFMEALK